MGPPIYGNDYGDNGLENGSYFGRLGLYKGSGKEHGNYYSACSSYSIFERTTCDRMRMLRDDPDEKRLFW